MGKLLGGLRLALSNLGLERVQPVQTLLAICYKSLKWIFRPFWVGFPYLTIFWGGHWTLSKQGCHSRQKENPSKIVQHDEKIQSLRLLVPWDLVRFDVCGQMLTQSQTWGPDRFTRILYDTWGIHRYPIFFDTHVWYWYIYLLVHHHDSKVKLTQQTMNPRTMKQQLCVANGQRPFSTSETGEKSSSGAASSRSESHWVWSG